MGAITVRAAVRSDLVALRQIFDSWHRGLVSLHGSPDGWLVAEVDGAVVGGLLAREFCAWDSGVAGFGHLTDADLVPFVALLCVDESLRGRGIGTCLVTHWIDSSPSWAHVVMPDQSGDDAAEADRVRFFERLGFAWMETEHPEIEPWLMMRKSSSSR